MMVDDITKVFEILKEVKKIMPHTYSHINWAEFEQ